MRITFAVSLALIAAALVIAQGSRARRAHVEIYQRLSRWLTPLFQSDRIGRKTIVLAGCLLAALTYFPIFKGLTHFGESGARSEYADRHRQP